jgi:hypothetical protein
MSGKCFRLMLLLVAVLVTSAQANLLTNGDFETGNLDPWYITNWGTEDQYITVVDDGTKVAEILTVGGDGIELHQDGIACGAGLPVVVSLDYKVASGSWNAMGVSINYWDASEGWLDYGWTLIYDNSTAGGGDDQWHTYTTAGKPAGSGVGELEGTWSVPLDTAEITMYISQWGWVPSGAHYDNVSLVPEPATITMLGLGGLALIRRRKRA